MDVSGIGGSATHADAIAKLANGPKVSAQAVNPAAEAVGQDSVARLLEQLGTPQISTLIQEVDNRRQGLDAEPAGDLFSRAAAATREGNVGHALNILSELVQKHPARAETLLHEPALTPIQPQVVGLVQRLTETVRIDAEQKIDAATHLMQGGGHGGAHRVELNPRSVITVAERLLESGGYSNVVLSAGLAEAVIEYYGPFPVSGAGAPGPGKAMRENVGGEQTAAAMSAGIARVGQRLAARAGRMWRSAPLLLMLIVWMAVGFGMALLALTLRELAVRSRIIDLLFDIWGVGFLGLIGFGFYRSIKRLRFR